MNTILNVACALFFGSSDLYDIVPRALFIVGAWALL